MVQVALRSFRIQNFRSIVDTGWKNLASDNVTILIGQNESGKTSILEGLQSFYSGEIIEDVLRGDQTMPIISCGFSLEGNHVLTDIIDIKKVPDELLKKIEKRKTFFLTRVWADDKSNEVFVSGEEIFDFFESIRIEEKKIEKLTIENIESIISKAENANDELTHIEQEKKEEENQLTLKRKLLDDFSRAHKKAKKPDLKLIAENDLKLAEKEYSAQEEKYIKVVAEHDRIKLETEKLNERLDVCFRAKKFLNRQVELDSQIAEAQMEVQEFRHSYELSTSFKDQKRNKKKLENAEIELRNFTQEQQDINDAVNKALLVAHKVITEKQTLKTAEYQADKEVAEKHRYYTLVEFGEALFSYVPVFEFFEDFSGLLPNKIDLEDILNEHEHIEGYKAARNFLKLAGLDSSFFREKNQRILKQRIASLNNEVSVNFQDYWSQQVGKDSKIKLHFELEHYDYTVPEKSGKPYLEFWIRDKNERLYPKQRSRGVRWFLSFYLELKAASTGKTQNRVLLIDEPGLSLHARAQEDVLKVFEDLKESMQIMYCTHSPHLVNTEKLYRVLAVQRAIEEDDKSESVVYEPSSLTMASADTLTPIYSLMGIRLSDQQFINPTNNIIVPDTTTYYYLHWLARLIPKASELNFIPASNSETIPLLVNILESWHINFGILVFAKQNKDLAEQIRNETLLTGEEEEQKKILLLNKFGLIEDIFSTLDFKKYILLKREGITDSNSRYILSNNLSRKILATNFVNNFDDSTFTIDKFDETSKKNIIELFDKLISLI